MTAFPVFNPFPLFEGINGLPLNDGYVYVGEGGSDPETHPVQLYADTDLTVPIAQPLRTQGGYIFSGSAPINVYASVSPYSIRVRDKAHNEIFYRAFVSNGIIQSPTGLTVENQTGTGDAIVIPNTDAYSGIGTATMGAPRTIWGTNTPSGDDACFIICRNIVGTSLFSQAVRDESTFLSDSSSAYTSFDSSYVYSSNSGTKANHSFGYEWRATFDASQGIDLFAGYTTSPVVQQGTIDRLYHFHAQALTKTGGTVSAQVGFYVSPLSGGVGNFGILVEANDNALLGNLQIAGTLIGATEINATCIQAVGGPNAYITTAVPAVFMAGHWTASGYSAVQSYIFDGTTVTGQGLALNPAGGPLLVGLESPVTGAFLEVGGSFGCSGPVGFNGAVPPAKPTITGSKGGNAALANLMAALSGMGLVTDSTT